MRASIAVLAAFTLLSAAGAQAQPECTSWQSMPFAQLSGPNGANNPVEALCVWNPPGGAARLVAAGGFSQIQGVAANNIATRNPETGQWEPLGAGTNGTIRALVVYNGELIAGGLFTQAGGQSASYIARWNGTSWQPLGSGMGDNVYALTVYNGELIAAGYFNNAGGAVAAHVARWNGSSWQPLGSGINDWVISLAVYNGELVAGGYFSVAGGVAANRIAKWNGSTWSALGTGTNAEVVAMTVYPGGLAIGGRFTSAGGLAATRIASWNGSWHTLSSAGMDGIVISLMSYRNELIAGGAFLNAGGTTVAGIARWTGSAWVALDLGLIGAADALYPWGDYLVVGGSFTEAGAHPASEIAIWDGLEWGSFGGGVCNSINAMTTYLGRVVAGGDLQQATTLGPPAHNLVGWNGADFNAYDDTMDAPVYSLKSFKYSGVLGANELIAGGIFLHAGGIAANRIARWQQGDITVPQGWQAMGAGFNANVLAIERHNNATYAGGAFTFSSAAVNRIARWNETTDVWEALGSGMNGNVIALKSYNGELYAGGSFTTAGGVATGGLARWNGTSWSSVGGTFNGVVYALEVHNGELVIGGSFSILPGSFNIARWNGTSFSSFGIGGANNTVRVLKSTGSRLYMGGDFTSVNGNTCRHIAWWNGIASWFEVDGGANSNVYALAYLNNEMHAGGAFNHVKNDLIESRCWAKYAETGVPWIAQHPSSQTVPNGGTASFTAKPAVGYDGLYIQWYHWNLPLSDGPTGTGSVVVGVHQQTLTITNTSLNDNGDYTMVVSNACGADTSLAAQLNPGAVDAPLPGALTTRLDFLGPNPSRGQAELGFSLARDADVRLRILDVAGRRVRDIEAGHLHSGTYRRTWNARNHAGEQVGAGLYFVSFEVDGHRVAVKRLTMLR